MTPCSDEEYFYKLDNLVISSTQYLHQAFKMRWKLEMCEDWKDEPDYVQNFFSQHCKSVLEKAMPLQKKILLSSCSLNDCDISLMSLVLLNFGNAKKYKLQNQAVRQLKDLRNDLAHHNSKKITQSEYCEKVKILKQMLKTLQIKECEIRKLTEEAPVSSSLDTIERVKKLLKNAEQFIILQDFESALKIYSEAIAIPKVLPVNLGEVYEKRAACYLSLTNTQYLDVTHADQAILDVEEALKLNKSSWNAHYLKAKCHKAKNNLSEAIQFYEMALALSPVQKKVRQDLDSCRLLNLTQEHSASLNLAELPMTSSEIVKQMEARTGQKVQYKYYSDSDALHMCPVVVGDGYYYGWGVSPDY